MPLLFEVSNASMLCCDHQSGSQSDRQTDRDTLLSRCQSTSLLPHPSFCLFVYGQSIHPPHRPTYLCTCTFPVVVVVSIAIAGCAQFTACSLVCHLVCFPGRAHLMMTTTTNAAATTFGSLTHSGATWCMEKIKEEKTGKETFQSLPSHCCCCCCYLVDHPKWAHLGLCKNLFSPLSYCISSIACTHTHIRRDGSLLICRSRHTYSHTRTLAISFSILLFSRN